MKKIQVVFAAAALLVASAATFANTLTLTQTYYKNTTYGFADCSGTVVTAVNCGITYASSCFKVEPLPDGFIIYYYSLREQDLLGPIGPIDRCTQLTKYLGTSPTHSDLP